MSDSRPDEVQQLIGRLEAADSWRDTSAILREIRSLAEQGSADLSLVVPRLFRLLSGGDEWVQETAANALGAMGDPRAVEPLCALLSFSPRRLPKHLGPKPNHTVLAHAMVAHDEDNVRHAAAVALGEIRSPQGLSALRASASNENETKRNRNASRVAIARIEEALLQGTETGAGKSGDSDD
jgi:hypothetical protein